MEGETLQKQSTELNSKISHNERRKGEKLNKTEDIGINE